MIACASLSQRCLVLGRWLSWWRERRRVQLWGMLWRLHKYGEERGPACTRQQVGRKRESRHVCGGGGSPGGNGSYKASNATQTEAGVTDFPADNEGAPAASSLAAGAGNAIELSWVAHVCGLAPLPHPAG